MNTIFELGEISADAKRVGWCCLDRGGYGLAEQNLRQQ